MEVGYSVRSYRDIGLTNREGRWLQCALVLGYRVNIEGGKVVTMCAHIGIQGKHRGRGDGYSVRSCRDVG
jgi:hypothetical protein